MTDAKPRVTVYVDGFNLYHRALEHSRYKWLNLSKLATFMLSEYDVTCIRYFTATVEYRANDPEQQLRQQVYIRALKTIPHLTVKYGLFKPKIIWLPRANPAPGEDLMVQVRKTDEKRSDVNLATYLLADGYTDQYDVAVVLTCDSDFQHPITVVREVLGKQVGVILTDPKIRPDVLRADFHRRIKPSILAACQFKELLEDANGTIQKPSAWNEVKRKDKGRP